MSRFTRSGFVALALALAVAILAPKTLLAGQENAEYAKARKNTVKLAESLKSYDLKGTMTMTNNVRGQVGGMSMEAETRGVARWPDRLLSSQSGTMFTLNLGTGPDQSWFYLSQLGNAYLGQPIKLSRDLVAAGKMELAEDNVFNFYVGVEQYLLSDDLPIVAETGTETVTVGEREISCQVFRTVGSDVIPAGAQSVEGPQTIHYDPESGLVLKSELTVYHQRDGQDFEQRVSFTLYGFELNGAVDDGVFNFAAPAGARVVGSLERLTNPDAMTNQEAPDITFTDLDGKKFQLSELRGQAVFIDFWATWCPPCKQEMPHIETLYHEFGKTGKIKIIAASSEDVGTITSFLGKKPYSFPVVTVLGDDAHTKFKATSIPAGFVIDAEGIIRAHMVGAQSEAQLRAAFAKAGVE